MKGRTIRRRSVAHRNTEQNHAYELTQLFVDFAQHLQADAKRFNEEHKETKERLENGTKLTEHRIAL